MNCGLPNLTKQKKKPRKTTKCHTKKNRRNTSKCHNIFAIFFFISSCGRSQFDIIILFITSTVFSQQILGEKLLLVLKLCIKKKKDNTRKLCVKP